MGFVPPEPHWPPASRALFPDHRNVTYTYTAKNLSKFAQSSQP